MAVSKDKAKQACMKVINDRVLIDPEEPEVTLSSKEVIEAVKEGTLVLPDEYAGAIKKTPEWGKVISWGDKCTYAWRYGMRVHFARLASANVIINKKEYRLVREYDIDLYELND